MDNGHQNWTMEWWKKVVCFNGSLHIITGEEMDQDELCEECEVLEVMWCSGWRTLGAAFTWMLLWHISTADQVNSIEMQFPLSAWWSPPPSPQPLFRKSLKKIAKSSRSLQSPQITIQSSFCGQINKIYGGSTSDLTGLAEPQTFSGSCGVQTSKSEPFWSMRSTYTILGRF